MTAGPGRPPKELQRDGRQALLDATLELIRDEGIERLTLRSVAERAGVGSALVNYYFGNKEGLKEAVVEEAVSELRERILVEEVGASAVEDLHSLIVRLIRGLGEKPYIARMIVELIVAGDEKILQKLVNNVALPNLEILQRLMTQGAREGVFRPVEIELVAPALMGASVYPLLIAPLLKALVALDLTEPAELCRFAAHTADLILEGLVARS